MFKGLGNINQIMQQAQQMNKKLTQVRKELDSKQESAQAGGGAVEVKINGKLEILAISIDDAVIKEGDRQMLQDLVTAATNEAIKKMQGIINKEMGKVTGGLNLPGMGF